MFKRLLWILFGCLVFNATHANNTLLLNVTLDYDEEVKWANVQGTLQTLARHLGSSLNQPVKLVAAQNAERIGEQIRESTYSIMLVPSPLAGLAIRHDYSPVAKTGGVSRVVLLAGSNSNIGSFEQAQGKRLTLPSPESLVSYVVNGELNSLGHPAKKYFSSVKNVRLYGAALYALELGQTDVIAIKEDVAKAWLAKSPGRGKIIKTLPDVPTVGAVVDNKLGDAIKEKIRLAFLNLPPNLATELSAIGLKGFEASNRSDFEYVSSIGYFTPKVMPGGKIVSADEVKDLLARGVPLFDVRPEADYLVAHVAGARSLPYQMKSPKEIGFDDKLDKWDTSKLPKDKNAPVIFQCNGAECWYSYKASTVAIKQGYKNVHWFREGLPSWKAKGYPIESGKTDG